MTISTRAARDRQEAGARPTVPVAGEHDLPVWLWLGLPLLLLIAQLAVLVADGGGSLYRMLFDGEYGIVESATHLSLAGAVAGGICATIVALRSRLVWVGLLLALFVLGSLFFLGEEINWGQIYFQWETPAYFQEHNRQGMINLHNLEGFNKKLLRETLLVGMLLGAIICTGSLIAKWRWRADRSWLLWLLPTRACLLPILVGVAAYLVVKAYNARGIETEDVFGIELRELVELQIGLFMFMYACSAATRLQRWRSGAPGSEHIGP